MLQRIDVKEEKLKFKPYGLKINTNEKDEA